MAASVLRVSTLSQRALPRTAARELFKASKRISKIPFAVESLTLRTQSTMASPNPIAYPTNHDRIEAPVDTQNFLENNFVSSQTTKWIDLHDPATNNIVTRVPQSTDAELRAAVESAQRAFPSWRKTSLLLKQQIMFKLVALIRANWDRLAASITLEQGKTIADAKGDVLRGLQVAETACGITTQLTGEVLGVAKDMETRSYKEPLGVVAAICPFSELCCSYGSKTRNFNLAQRFSSDDSSLVHSSSHCHGQLLDT